MAQTFDLLARLKADVSDFQTKMGSASDMMGQFSGDTGDAMQSVGNAMSAVGAGMTAGITVPLIAGAAASVKAFATMEDAMHGVQKTTNLSDVEISKMKDSLQEMSAQMPVAATELAGIAEAAGQLGIENKNILGFTDTIAKLGSATNLAYEEGATALAQFANITQMAQGDFDRLGSVIVELGNNTAATEADIVSMAQRLAATGSMMGLTEAEIMGLSGAMASVGIEAEAGGTAMSMALKKMDASVRESGSELEEYARISGMTAEEFASAWSEAPDQAISSFIEGLGEMMANGEDANAALESLGITGIRETDTLLRLAGAGELTAEAFEMASDAWEENTALSEEAETAWGSMSSQAKMLWNQITNLAESFGERLAPAIGVALSSVSGLLDSFSNMSTGAQNLILIVAGLAAALGPILLVGGKLLALAGKFSIAFGTAGTVLGALGNMFPALAAGVKLFGAAFAALSGPIGIVIGLIALFVAGLIYLWQTNEAFREGVIAAWTAISETISSAVQTVVSFVMELWGMFMEWWTENQELFRSAAEAVWNALLSVISIVMGAVVPLIVAGWEIISAVTSAVWSVIGSVVKAGMDVILSVITLVMAIIEGDSSSIWEAIKGVASAVWNAIVTIISTLINSALSIISSVLSTISSIWSSMWTAISTKLSEIWQSIVTTVSTKFSEVVSAVRTGMGNALTAVKEKVGDFLSAGENIVRNIARGIRNGINWVTGAIGDVLSAARDLLPFSPPKDKSSPLVDIHKNGIVEQIAKGITNQEGMIVDALSSTLDKASTMVDGFNIGYGVELAGTASINNDLLRTNRQISGSIDHNLQTRDNTYYFNLRMGRNDYELMTEDITEIQGRRQSISTRRR